MKKGNPMKEYHKIKTVFKRDSLTNYKTLIYGDYAIPEFEYLKDSIWTFTEKVDGMNTRIMFDGFTIKFGGKTDTANIPQFFTDMLYERFLPLFKTFKTIWGSKKVCLYGEGYGAKIRHGGGYRPDQGFIIVDVKIDEWWLQRRDVILIGNRLNIDVIPLIGMGSLKDMVEIVMEGFPSKWNDELIAEGIVARPRTELKTRGGERIITKLKYNDFARLKKYNGRMYTV